MSKTILIVITLIALVSSGILMGCSMAHRKEKQIDTPKKNIITYTVAQFKELLAQGNTELQLVDARTAKEFTQGHIEGAINIDITASTFDQEAQKLLKKENPIAIYCRSGVRSMKAANRLVKLGFSGPIYNLERGYMAYKSIN